MFLAQFSLSTRGKRPVREGLASQFILVRTEFEHRTKQDTFRRMRANVIVADAREIAIRGAHDSNSFDGQSLAFESLDQDGEILRGDFLDRANVLAHGPLAFVPGPIHYYMTRLTRW